MREKQRAEDAFFCFVESPVGCSVFKNERVRLGGVCDAFAHGHHGSLWREDGR